MTSESDDGGGDLRAGAATIPKVGGGLSLKVSGVSPKRRVSCPFLVFKISESTSGARPAGSCRQRVPVPLEDRHHLAAARSLDWREKLANNLAIVRSE